MKPVEAICDAICTSVAQQGALFLAPQLQVFYCGYVSLSWTELHYNLLLNLDESRVQ